MLCNHQWHKESETTLVCNKCGKVRNIPCCHRWKTYDQMWNEIHDGWGGVEKFRQDTLICEKCGTVKQVRI